MGGCGSSSEAIEGYATEMAGTRLDLDSAVESAVIEHLVKGGKMKRGDVCRADLVPRWGSEQTGAASRNRGVSRRFRLSSRMEVYPRGPDFRVLIARRGGA